MTGPLRPPADDGAHAAAARFMAAAPADVAFRELDSPLGTLVAATTEDGLVRLAYEAFNGGLDAVLDDLARRVSPRVLRQPGRLDTVAHELEEYFAGRRTTFDVPVDLRVVTPFGRRVLEACAAVPYGRLATYGEIAREAGDPAASRAAGRALGANPVPIVVPCHRVVGAGGRLTGYTGGLEKKVALLELEGAALGRDARA